MNIVKFFNPHPGTGGAIMPLPLIVKGFADLINNKEYDVEQILEMFYVLFPNGSFGITDQSICLMYTDELLRTHYWTVIRFKKMEFDVPPLIGERVEENASMNPSSADD